MNVAVGVQDECGNTDNIVLVNTTEKTLTWIPRDLFSPYLRNRVNAAFVRGGHDLFLKVLKKLGFEASYSICIPNQTMRMVLTDYQITVPVEHTADYYYPIKASEPIENGRKIVSFKPPYETLSGERIHQFLGARYRVNPCDYLDLSDFERIKRQMVFVKQMLIEKFNFLIFLNFLDEKTAISDPKVIPILALVNADYEFKLYRNVRKMTINTRSVLVMADKPLVMYKSLFLKYYYSIYHFLNRFDCMQGFLTKTRKNILKRSK